MKLPNKRKYPKTLLIDDEEWRVVFKKGLRCGKSPAWGLTDPVKRVIYIHAKADRKMRFLTFIHEVLHAMALERGFKLGHKYINPLEKAIFRLLVDNF